MQFKVGKTDTIKELEVTQINFQKTYFMPNTEPEQLNVVAGFSEQLCLNRKQNTLGLQLDVASVHLGSRKDPGKVH